MRPFHDDWLLFGGLVVVIALACLVVAACWRISRWPEWRPGVHKRIDAIEVRLMSLEADHTEGRR